METELIFCEDDPAPICPLVCQVIGSDKLAALTRPVVDYCTLYAYTSKYRYIVLSFERRG
jgi:hypothetical protein